MAGEQSNDCLIYLIPKDRKPKSTSNKKNLIMSSLLWLMIKDNYFFIPLAKAEYVPSDVAT